MGNNPKYNASGSPDPTAHQAIKHVSDADKRVFDLIKAFKIIAAASGLEITNRINIRDKKTGREWY